MTGPLPYEYVVLRCVPRADREEFVNLAVVLHCRPADYLRLAHRVDPVRLHALWPGLDATAVAEAVAFADDVCAGSPRAGAAAEVSLSQRFGFLKAPRSTVVRPGPVHGGLTTDPAATLGRLLASLVG